METYLQITKVGVVLVFSGATLFFAGLFQGTLIPKLKNSRMGLSAHLAAVQSGMAIMIFGVIWGLVKLSPVWNEIAWVGVVSGNYLIWIGMTIAASTGASKAMPIAGSGFSGSLGAERFVSRCTLLGVIVSLISGVLVFVGLSRSTLDVLLTA